MMRAAGFQCDVTAKIHHEYWIKVVGNLSFNTVSTLTGAWTDWLIDTAGTRALCANLIAEAFEIGRKLGLEIEQTPEARIAETRTLGHVKTSMLQDAEKGKPLEIEAILGVTVEIGERLGLSIPHMKAVLALARMKDRVLRGAEQAVAA